MDSGLIELPLLKFLVLEAGASIAEVNEEGKTVLLLAAAAENDEGLEAVKWLV
jgi:ankyrin repeat protein